MFADRNSGRLGGLNAENGGAPDAKNLRVKVLNWHNHCNGFFVTMNSYVVDYYFISFILFIFVERERQTRKKKREEYL